jgi:hypothetical protein
MFQGGGNIPLIVPVLAELTARGHAVKVLVGPGVRPSHLQVSQDLGEFRRPAVSRRDSLTRAGSGAATLRQHLAKLCA